MSEMTQKPSTQRDQIAELKAKLAEYELKDQGVLQGFAVCPNPACEECDKPAPLAIVVDVMERRNDMGVESTHEYVHPHVDTDLPCPSCGMGRMAMKEAPRKYAALAPR